MKSICSYECVPETHGLRGGPGTPSDLGRPWGGCGIREGLSVPGVSVQSSHPPTWRWGAKELRITDVILPWCSHGGRWWGLQMGGLQMIQESQGPSEHVALPYYIMCEFSIATQHITADSEAYINTHFLAHSPVGQKSSMGLGCVIGVLQG